MKMALKRLYRLAQQATDDETVDDLAVQMNGLEKQKHDAELLLYGFEEQDEQAEELEKEIRRFEQWAEEGRPQLTDPTYQPSYQELRLAVRVLGITCTLYPTRGDLPFPTNFDITIPTALHTIILPIPS